MYRMKESDTAIVAMKLRTKGNQRGSGSEGPCLKGKPQDSHTH